MRQGLRPMQLYYNWTWYANEKGSVELIKTILSYTVRLARACLGGWPYPTEWKKKNIGESISHEIFNSLSLKNLTGDNNVSKAVSVIE